MAKWISSPKTCLVSRGEFLNGSSGDPSLQRRFLTIYILSVVRSSEVPLFAAQSTIDILKTSHDSQLIIFSRNVLLFRNLSEQTNCSAFHFFIVPILLLFCCQLALIQPQRNISKQFALNWHPGKTYAWPTCFLLELFVFASRCFVFPLPFLLRV